MRKKECERMRKSMRKRMRKKECDKENENGKGGM